MKIKLILYWIVTGLLSLFLAFAVFNYLTKFEMVQEMLQSYNYPSYLIYVLIIGKVLGIIALLVPVKGVLKEWAYAGLFYNFILAFLVHYAANDGEGGGAVIALVLLIISYFLGKQVRPWFIRG
ncbi:DoxX family protein [Galbibacter orientalis]|uniref:DoxX family protein n=1 Tax=Galbibacter orientalis TaxID=453852 RepID=UPI0030805809